MMGKGQGPMETHKKSPDPAWVEGMSRKAFREGDAYMERNRNKLASKSRHRDTRHRKKSIQRYRGMKYTIFFSFFLFFFTLFSFWKCIASPVE